MRAGGAGILSVGGLSSGSNRGGGESFHEKSIEIESKMLPGSPSCARQSLLRGRIERDGERRRGGRDDGVRSSRRLSPCNLFMKITT